MTNRAKIFIVFFCFPLFLFAQPEFNMTDTLVTDCEGFLLDSDLGDVEGNYDHNENYTFSICIEDADGITIDFLEFCTEFLFDSLRVFDGPDTLSPLLGGPFLGEDEPPNMTATSGCLTVNFITDPSVTCTGWTAHWFTEFIIPEPPEILPIPNLACESNQITLEFDENIHCDSLYASAFSIIGPQFPNVISTTPINCVGDSTNTVLLTFAPPIDFSGNYTVTFIQNIGWCEVNYVLESTADFLVSDCPLNIILELDGQSVCSGEASVITTEVSGGDPTSYIYTWSPTPSNEDFLEISISNSTTFYVTVSDGSGATATDSILVIPLSLPSLSIPDTILCESDSAFILTALPSGGEWFGAGISDDETETGLYNPDLVEFLGDTVIYVDPNGCFDSLFINYIPLDEGTDDAACIGADTFFVSGGLPVGGVWSGENISTEGIFSPPDSMSSFLVTYTHPNGCSGSKWINIDSLVLSQIDSLCQSEEPFDIPAVPFGGIWSGTGIVDEDTGRFDPDEANLGDNILIYNVEGCSDTMTIHIKQIDAGDNFSACPEESPFIVPGDWEPQTGGTWTGIGITNANTGLFDPSLIPDVRDTLYFEIEGCVDSRIAFVLQTTIDIEEDTLYFCPESEAIFLPIERPTVFPQNGVWYGTGVTNPAEEEFYFNPNIAGTGVHQLYYEQNTCVDSIAIVVHPTPIITPLIFCEIEPPSPLEVTPSGGIWEGQGIINSLSGVFDPAIVGAGNYNIINTSNAGCVGNGTITVLPFQEAELSIDEFYCFTNQNINLNLNPNGGTLLINNELSTNFNPAILGTGDYTLTYTVGSGACEDTEMATTSVGEAISLMLPFEEDSLCNGDFITLSASATGGSSQGNFTYTWNNNLGFGQSQFIQPNGSGLYIVTVEDGCSDSVSDTISLTVAPPIYVDFETNEPVCFDELTTAEVIASPGDNYTYTWNTLPPTIGSFIESYPTSFTVNVLDNDTQCHVDATIDLPGWDLLEANFGISPNEDCINTLDPQIQILDFSEGGTTGYWDFGDSTSLEIYRPEEDIFHIYQDTGFFTVTLHLENAGGCVSQHQENICVEAAHTIFAPNAFTPNGDGVNDEFGFVGTNIEEIKWQVYNRYGHLIYEAEDIDDRWDGKFKGQRIQDGVYTWYAIYKAVGDVDVRDISGFVVILK